MSFYRIEWPCCGDVSETNCWEPERCPFCSIPAAQVPDGWRTTIPALRERFSSVSLDKFFDEAQAMLAAAPTYKEGNT